MAYKERHTYDFFFVCEDGFGCKSQRLIVTHRLPDRELYDRAADFMPEGTQAATVSEDGEEVFRMERVTRHGFRVRGKDGYDHLYTT